MSGRASFLPRPKAGDGERIAQDENLGYHLWPEHPARSEGCGPDEGSKPPWSSPAPDLHRWVIYFAFLSASSTGPGQPASLAPRSLLGRRPQHQNRRGEVQNDIGRASDTAIPESPGLSGNFRRTGVASDNPWQIAAFVEGRASRRVHPPHGAVQTIRRHSCAAGQAALFGIRGARPDFGNSPGWRSRTAVVRGSDTPPRAASLTKNWRLALFIQQAGRTAAISD